MCADNFNYNEFMKLSGIKTACDDVFDFAMWSFYAVEIRVESESFFINKLRSKISRLIKKIHRYSNYNPRKVRVSVEILNKTDIKKMYKDHFGNIDDTYMRWYMRCKKFCNKVVKYLNESIYKICYCKGYGADNCKEIDYKIYEDLRSILYEC